MDLRLDLDRWINKKKCIVLIYLTTSSNELMVDVADSVLDWTWRIDNAANFANTYIKTYEVTNLQIHITVRNADVGTAYLFADVYLMA